MSDFEFGENSYIQYLVGASRIRYSVLDTIGITPLKTNHIVLFIDLHSVLYRIFRTKDLAALNHVPYEVIVKDLTVGIINIAAHYRRYFYTRLKKSNDILFFFNKKLPEYQKKYCPEFNRKLYDRYDPDNPTFGVFGKALEDAIKYIQSLVPYFTGVYFINNMGVDDFAAMKMFMDEPDYADAYQIILTKNMFAAQLLQPNRIILFNGRSNSYTINHTTTYSKGVLNGRKTQVSEHMLPEYLPLLWMVSGCTDVEIKPTKYCKRLTAMCEIADTLATSGKLTPGMSPEYFIDVLTSVKNMKNIADGTDTLLDRYRALNINLAEKAITINQIKRFQEGLIELYDQTELERLNDNLAKLSSNSELIELTALNMARISKNRFDDINFSF